LTTADLFVVQAHFAQILASICRRARCAIRSGTEAAFRSLAVADHPVRHAGGDFSRPDDTGPTIGHGAGDRHAAPQRQHPSGWRNRLVVGKADGLKEHPLTVYAVSGGGSQVLENLGMTEE